MSRPLSMHVGLGFRAFQCVPSTEKTLSWMIVGFGSIGGDRADLTNHLLCILSGYDLRILTKHSKVSQHFWRKQRDEALFGSFHHSHFAEPNPNLSAKHMASACRALAAKKRL